MKKLYFYPLMLSILFLPACGSSSGLQPASASSNDTMPIETQLVIGTLKLESTEQAVTDGQATELLVMWQVYQDLNSSSTAAQAEIDGLVEQIQETMTAEQMKAISAMNLSQQDVFAIMQEQGVGMGQVRQSSNSGSSTQSGGGFAPPDGGMAGGPPDTGMVGGAPPDGGIGDLGSAAPDISTDQSQAAGASSGFGGTAGIPTVLVDALIQYLEQVANS